MARSSGFARLGARILQPFRGDGGGWMLAAAIIVTSLLASFAAYQKWGYLVSSHPMYRVGPEQIEVTPPQPTWIYGNVKAEVIRDGSLEDLSAIDPDLTVRVLDAFELHPWVERVNQIRKEHPNRVAVQLTYRRPIAMVEVFDEGTRWLSPIDRSGYVLPIDGFAQKLDKPENYLRIYVGASLSPGVAGTQWSDVRIRDAALLAAVLQDHWQSLQLYRIVVLPSSEEYRTPQFALATRDQAPVIWGSGPGQEEPGEARTADKFARLREFAAQNPLANLPADQSLDLRKESGAVLTPRTARREIP